MSLPIPKALELSKINASWVEFSPTLETFEEAGREIPAHEIWMSHHSFMQRNVGLDARQNRLREGSPHSGYRFGTVATVNDDFREE